jgi:hypothetical protein
VLDISARACIHCAFAVYRKFNPRSLQGFAVTAFLQGFAVRGNHAEENDVAFNSLIRHCILLALFLVVRTRIKDNFYVEDMNASPCGETGRGICNRSVCR